MFSSHDSYRSMFHPYRYCCNTLSHHCLTTSLTHPMGKVFISDDTRVLHVFSAFREQRRYGICPFDIGNCSTIPACKLGTGHHKEGVPQIQPWRVAACEESKSKSRSFQSTRDGLDYARRHPQMLQIVQTKMWTDLRWVTFNSNRTKKGQDICCYGWAIKGWTSIIQPLLMQKAMH